MGASASVPQKPLDLGPEYHVPYSKENAPHSVTLITDERPIRYARKGIASEAESPARTVIEIIRKVESMQSSYASALRVERPCPPLDPVTKKAPPPMDPTKLTTWTYAEYFAEARSLAAALVGLGFQERDTVCIFGFNAPEWHMSALAAVMAHGSFSGIYPSDTPQQIQWKALLTNASVAFVDSNSGADRFIRIVDQLPYLKAVVHWGDDFDKTKGPISRVDGSQVQYLHWKDALECGVGHDAEVESRMNAAKPSDCCNLIFTSGTTGKPKAAMLSHDNIIHCCHIASASIRKFINIQEQQRTLSYLPLSHIAGTVFDIFLPIVSMFDYEAVSDKGWEVTMARPYDLKAGSLKDRLVLTRPTIFLGVPRVWEKIHERMLIIGSKVKGAKRKIANWAKSKSLRNAEDAQVGRKGTTPFGYGVASGLLAKIKKALGLDCCRLGFSGAAPLKMATLRYFASINIQINELYGMSECTGTTTMSTPLTHTWGSVGFPLPGVEIKIFKPSSEAGSASDDADKVECPRAQDLFRPQPAEEGEICFRGRHIMLGYLANPSLGEDHVLEMRRKNREAIDNEGWLHSGDKGCIDTSGMLRVTGRYKELIIGAGGENIAPVPIEDAILEACPAISNVIMIGDKRKFNVALVTLKTEGATGELPGSDDLAGPALDLVDGVTKVSEAIASETFAEKVTDVLVAVNKNGEVVPSNAAKIQKFMILRQDFSITTGELTATLKLKRSVVEDMYKNLIDSMYESGETYVQCPP